MKRRSSEQQKEMNMRILGLAGNIVDAVLRVLLLVVIIYVIIQGAKMCYDYGFRIFTEKPMASTTGRDVTVTIPVDFSAKELGELFEKNGLSRDSKLLILQYYCSEYKDDIKGGEYTLNTTMTAEEMFESIAEINIAKEKLAEELKLEQEAKEAAQKEKEENNAEGLDNDVLDDQPITEIDMEGLNELTEDNIR